ncbi:guanylate kinase [Mytilinidion resinicola]|uniref:Guanylate kinase n=1 Tax=Mytilinidion resinicola TaxID=574789 RepID=A0A6A6YKV1_9PEZI|nr:guanylate kinase [Mytilinidion resinicola]KAF2809502.1 guanylate kinase [Mytilinidion resinicola]
MPLSLPKSPILKKRLCSSTSISFKAQNTTHTVRAQGYITHPSSPKRAFNRILTSPTSLTSSSFHRSRAFTNSFILHKPFNSSIPPTMAPIDPMDSTTPPQIDRAALAAHQPIVISGPSGSGKSTILKRLFDEHKGKFGFSVSHTTRSPRAHEKDGEDYHFVTREFFNDLVKKGGFIESATFGGNSYGTSIAAVQKIAEEGKVCILDIEMEGVKQVASHPFFPKPKFLFLQPPSLEVLETRLRGRGTDHEDAVIKRLNQAKVEMAFAKSGEAPHDKVVINDDLDRAYEEVRKCIVEGEWDDKEETKKD